MESCISVGLTTVLTSVTDILVHWAASGDVLSRNTQGPAEIFVDCSNRVDRRIGLLAEQSFDDLTRRLDRLPVILMALRLIDWGVKHNASLRRTNIATTPYAIQWIGRLGDVLYDRLPESASIKNSLDEKALALADKLADENPDVKKLLEDESTNPDPVWRLAEGLCQLMSRSNLWGNLYGGLDGFLNTDRPNGIAAKRRIRQTDPVTGKRTREIRSVVLTDSVLDYLVHLHVLPGGNRHGVRLPRSRSLFISCISVTGCVSIRLRRG